MKLRGNPWSAVSGGDGYHGRTLLFALLSCFTGLGWRLLFSAGITSDWNNEEDSANSWPNDPSSWFFIYDGSLLSATIQSAELATSPGGVLDFTMAPPSYEEVLKGSE